jgi:membrane protein DedA with SNARE-associated domain
MTLLELTDLIQRYDAWVYGFIFAYCFGKTGPLPMLAGFAAAQGALRVDAVLVLALLGATCGAQLRFWIGRLAAPWICTKLPNIAPWLALAGAGVERYCIPVLLAYRFVKGSFAAVCIGAGTSMISWTRFTVIDCLGAIVWVGGMVGIGWAFAQLGAAMNPDWAAYVGVAFLALSIAVFALLGKRIKAKLLPMAERILAERTQFKKTII